jgi:hypothetical protein
MIIKYFDEFNGQYIDLTGTTGQGLEYGASGWVTTSKSAYKTFVGEMNQSGTDDPTINTYFNNTGAAFTMGRDDVGFYRLFASVATFVEGEMWWYIGNNQTTFGYFNYQAQFINSTQMQIITRDNGSVADDLLQHTSFEFRKY